MAPWLKVLEGKVPETHLAEARQADDPVALLLARTDLTPKRLLAAMSAYYRRPALTLGNYEPDDGALALMSHDVARRLGILPLFTVEGRLWAAVADPSDLDSQDQVLRLTGMAVETVVALRNDLEEALTRHYLSRQRMRAEVAAQETPTPASEGRPDELEDRDAPAIRALDEITSRAVLLGASDIHLERQSNRALLRYRIDGRLHEFPAPPAALYPSVISRLKISSHLDIAEKRLPQDGRAFVDVQGRTYDLRVSIIPNMFGEGAVIRILDTGQAANSLEDLGFSADMLDRYDRLVRKPHGIFLVTGPTGSGKSTTLYSTLRRILDPSRKMITLEDPVEYQLDGLTQIPIRADIGFTFASALRSILRHDPDVVMLGEIRDLESAEIALRASLTGHLLFATLHTNDAPLAITRLVDLGLQPYRVLASLLGVLAQRLVRKLCPACRREVEPGPAELEALGLPAWPEGGRLFEPVGCRSCGGVGYKGRVAVYELLEVTREMRRLRSDEVTPENLRSLAEGAGMVSLRRSAMDKLFAGVTGLEEVLAVTAGD